MVQWDIRTVLDKTFEKCRKLPLESSGHILSCSILVTADFEFENVMIVSSVTKTSNRYDIYSLGFVLTGYFCFLLDN